MPLTHLKVERAKPKEKQYKLTDERGMYLLIHPKGGKWWRFDYRYQGKRKTLSLGIYPDVLLKVARKKRDDARSILDGGVDPAYYRKSNKELSADSFEAVAREWYQKFEGQWATSHATKTLGRLEKDLLPWVGSRPIAAIEPPELLRVYQRIEKRGALETAHRIHQIAVWQILTPDQRLFMPQLGRQPVMAPGIKGERSPGIPGSQMGEGLGQQTQYEPAKTQCWQVAQEPTRLRFKEGILTLTLRFPPRPL